MKRVIKASSDLKNYTVWVSFGGYIGIDLLYDVTAEDEEAAEIDAIDLAKEDLSVIDIAQTDEDEWEVTVGFGGRTGGEETYTVYAGTESEACDVAIEEAADDLSAEVDDAEDDEDDE